MTIKIEIEKSPLKHFTPSKWVKWCVTVTTDDPDGFPAGWQWALDFPPDTDILDPKQAKKIKGAPKYGFDPNFGEGTITKGGENSFKICFVATSKDRENTDMSLERRWSEPEYPGLTEEEYDEFWTPVPWEDAPEGVGKVVGPGAVASNLSPIGDTLGVLATFEALKLSALLHSAPPQSLMLPIESVKCVSKPRIYVMALDSWERCSQSKKSPNKENPADAKKQRG